MRRQQAGGAGVMQRYALYYVPPPGTPLAEFGARWLGRDIDGADVAAPPDLARLPVEDWRRAVTAPRRYGFHATLKAPFRLAPGRDEQALVDALGRFCRARAPAPVGKLALRVLAGFLVFAPMDAGAAGPIDALAADCVREFDRFSAPLTEAESARRRTDRLTAPQKANLERWGYPHVMEHFRFHLTLTDRLDDAERARFGAEIARMAGPALAEPVAVSGICLCGEPEPGADFRPVTRFGLTGPAGAR